MKPPKGSFKKRVKRSDGRIFESINAAKRDGYSAVSHVLSGKQKATRGYRWAYCDENGNIINNKGENK
jgi:hypothetical protein